jgi:hypothetical protein
MTKQNLTPLALVVGIAIILQLVLIGVDCNRTPGKVAKNFAEAYYYLNADMQKYLCKALAEESDTVSDYLYRKQLEASQRGLSTNYLRHKLVHAHLEIVESSADTAKIHLSGTTRVCINPVFMLVGKLFQLGQDYSVDETLELIKEEGRWRVCSSSLDL